LQRRRRAVVATTNEAPDTAAASVARVLTSASLGGVHVVKGQHRPLLRPLPPATRANKGMAKCKLLAPAEQCAAHLSKWKSAKAVNVMARTIQMQEADVDIVVSNLAACLFTLAQTQGHRSQDLTSPTARTPAGRTCGEATRTRPGIHSPKH